MPEGIERMTSFVLKLIACIAMLIDHVTSVFVKPSMLIWELDLSWATPEMITDSILWTVGIGIGRIAFPIFAFLIVEGLVHTRDKKKYALRLLLAALASEIPFNLLGHGEFFYPGKQNVLWTLLLGFIAISVIDSVKEKFPGDYFKYNTFSCLAILVCGAAAMLLMSDYSIYGVMLVVALYMLRGRKVLSSLMLLLLTWLLYKHVPIQFGAMLSVPFLILYNGKKGMDDKYCLYAFYPVHMLILGLLVRFVL